MSKKGVWKSNIFLLVFDAKIGRLKWSKKGFRIVLLQFKRFRWSRKLIENGVQMPSTSHSLFKPWASMVAFFEIFMDFGKLVVFMFFCLAKRRAKNANKSNFWRKGGSKERDGKSL